MKLEKKYVWLWLASNLQGSQRVPWVRMSWARLVWAGLGWAGLGEILKFLPVHIYNICYYQSICSILNQEYLCDK